MQNLFNRIHHWKPIHSVPDIWTVRLTRTPLPFPISGLLVIQTVRITGNGVCPDNGSPVNGNGVYQYATSVQTNVLPLILKTKSTITIKHTFINLQMKWRHFMDLQLERRSWLRNDGSILCWHLKDVLLFQLRGPDQRWGGTHEYVIAKKRIKFVKICRKNACFSAKMKVEMILQSFNKNLRL